MSAILADGHCSRVRKIAGHVVVKVLLQAVRREVKVRNMRMV